MMRWLLLLACATSAAGPAARKQTRKAHGTAAKVADDAATPPPGMALPEPVADTEGACVVDVVRTQFDGVSQLSVLGPSPQPVWLNEVIPAVGVPVVLMRRPRGPGRDGNRSDPEPAPRATAGLTGGGPRLHTHNTYTDAVLVLTKGTVGSGVERSLAVLPHQPRQRVVVWLPHRLHDSKELRSLLTALVLAAWRRRLLRLVIVVSQEETGPVAASKCAVYTMRAYPAVCRRKPATLRLECSWTSSPFSPAPGCLGRRSVFEEPRLLDLRGCRFQVAVSVESPYAMYSKRKGRAQGMVGDLLYEWAHYGNFSVSVTDRASRVTRYQSSIAGGALGIVGDVVVERKDMAIGAFLLTTDRQEAVSHAQSYSILHYEFVVPTGLAPTSSLLNLFSELDADLWVYVNIALVVVAAATRALWRRSSGLGEDSGSGAAQADNSVPSLVAALTILAAAMVDVPAPARWRNERGDPLRIVLTSWILFCLVLNTAYESMLLSRLTTNVEDDNIHSLEELADLSMPLFVSPSVLHYARLAANESALAHHTGLARVLQRATVCPADVFGMAFEGVAVGRNITALWAGATTLYALQRLEHRFHDGADVDYNLHSFGQMLSLPVTYIIFPKNSPLVEQADHVLARLNEAGVLAYWMSGLTDVKRWAAVRGRAPDRVIISMKHVSPVFYMLEIGQGAAALAFLGEIWYARRAARRARRRARAAERAAAEEEKGAASGSEIESDASTAAKMEAVESSSEIESVASAPPTPD